MPPSGRPYRTYLSLPYQGRRDEKEGDNARRGERGEGERGEEERVEGALLKKGRVRAFKSR